MIVTFPKNNIRFLILFLSLIFLGFLKSSGQVKYDTCNREVKLKEYEKALIKEICIPKGYYIYFIPTKQEDIDINGDSLPDFIFDWTKKDRQEGDTSFITVYKMNPDSSYSFLKTFNNLLPIDLN